MTTTIRGYYTKSNVNAPRNPNVVSVKSESGTYTFLVTKGDNLDDQDLKFERVILNDCFYEYYLYS